MSNSEFNDALNKLLNEKKDIDKLTPETAGSYLKSIADEVMSIINDLYTFQNLVRKHPDIAQMIDAKAFEEYEKAEQRLKEVVAYLNQNADLLNANYENLMTLYGPPEDFEDHNIIENNSDTYPFDDDDDSWE